MDRAYELNQSANPPAPPNPPVLGYPSETAPATVPGAWWFHQMTEELRNVLVAGGIVPDATKVNQVAAAIVGIIQASNIAWTQITGTKNADELEGDVASTSATPNTIALRDGSAGLTSASFNVSSARQLKRNIKPIMGALDRLDLYPAVTYQRKGTGANHAGFLADEFAKARPEGIRKDRNGHDAIDVMAVAAELATALREERDARRALEARLARLENR